MKTATLLCLAGFLFSGCNRSPSTISGPLPQRAYIWQREWTAAVTEGLREAEDRVSGVVLLAGEIEWKGNNAAIVRPTVDWKVAKARGTISVALRVAPFPLRSGDDPRIKTIIDVVRLLLDDVRSNGINLQEFQLDFDCAQSGLVAYRECLDLLRPIIHPVRFVITTLPAWLDDANFTSLLLAVDGYVLQVHSVPIRKNESMTLCDPRWARRWTAKAARLGRPFSVALPTYRCSAGYNSAGQLLGISMDSVQATWPPNTRVLEFTSDADALASLVNEWQHARPRELRELIWYRAPLVTDLRNWRWKTLSAVMAGRKPGHRLRLAQEGENPIDLSIVNEGEAEEELESALMVTWNGRTLIAADALAGWTVDVTKESATFTVAEGHNIRLRPGATRKIGWLRYDQPANPRFVLAKNR